MAGTGGDKVKVVRRGGVAPAKHSRRAFETLTERIELRASRLDLQIFSIASRWSGRRQSSWMRDVLREAARKVIAEKRAEARAQYAEEVARITAALEAHGVTGAPSVQLGLYKVAAPMGWASVLDAPGPFLHGAVRLVRLPVPWKTAAGGTGAYDSGVLLNPTLLEIVVHAELSIRHIGDHHHVFLEDLREAAEGEVEAMGLPGAVEGEGEGGMEGVTVLVMEFGS